MPNDPRAERVLRWASAVLVGFVVIGTAMVLASLAFDRGGAGGADGADGGTSGAGSAAEATPSPSEAVDDPSPSATTPTNGMSADGMTAFLDDYLSTVTRDPAAAWRRLTPEFQSASGGYSAYVGFWGAVTSAKATGVFADPDAGRITYRVTYTYVGGRSDVDSTRLELVLRDGEYLIEGEG